MLCGTIDIRVGSGFCDQSDSERKRLEASYSDGTRGSRGNNQTDGPECDHKALQNVIHGPTRGAIVAAARGLARWLRAGDRSGQE